MLQVAGGSPGIFCQRGRGAMPSVLSIFADESGEWGKRSEYYLITLVFS